MRDGDPPQYFNNDVISNFTVNVFQVYLPTFDLSKFQSTIRSYGFVDSWDIDLLTQRYFYGRSLRQIAEETPYVSKNIVHRRLKKLHDLLKERGIAPKDKDE
jgi:hypothetical protein